MRLLDTNVLIYARTKDSPFRQWAEEELVEAVSAGGAVLSAVSIAELCAAAEDPEMVADEVRALVLTFWTFQLRQRLAAVRPMHVTGQRGRQSRGRIRPPCPWRISSSGLTRNCLALNLSPTIRHDLKRIFRTFSCAHLNLVKPECSFQAYSRQFA